MLLCRTHSLRTWLNQMKQKLKRILEKRQQSGQEAADNRFHEAVQGLPAITSETVASHREEILSSARKYIYPLQHSKHRIVVVSTSLLTVVVASFFVYCGLALYHFQSNSSFLYRVTQVIPFPVAKAGSRYVSYENYLFELRHYEHYYQSQQMVDFSTTAGKQQLAAYKKEALAQVIDQAYVKQLADAHNISVSDQDVNDEITLVRNQDRLGSSDKVFADVLKEFYGWSVDDFKRELKQELLTQKVVAALDTKTQQQAAAVLVQLQKGADFGSLAAQISDDTTTKTNGGQFGFAITRTDQTLPPQTINALFSLKVGQLSNVINIGYGLEIDKLLSVDGDKVQAAHIVLNFQKIDTYLAPLKARNKSHSYIKV